ncbi:MAG: Rho termination factor N-terminal domain-containing protein, partial [Alphaproteobacteria bacterium]|nr:Rho termination factor N-terminal domain-containing protein [Alphaproteobacteria bacterium]
MYIKDLKSKSPAQLVQMAEDLKVENPGQHNTQHLRFLILKQLAKNGDTLTGDGTLELLPDGFGFLRAPEASYVSGPDDLYISPVQIRKYSLKTGDSVEGEVRSPRDGEKYFALHKILKVNDKEPEKAKHRIHFDNLTPLYPEERLKLEIADKKTPNEDIVTRMIDLVSPQGKGQRSLVVAPPRTGKTVMLQNLAHAITANHPDIKLIVLLIDERPEEVTD